MGKRAVGLALLLVIGTGLILGVYFFTPVFNRWKQTKTSDAKGTKGKIRIGVDNWIGYYILSSSEMKKRMRGSGYILEITDDNADYAGRMEKLHKGEYDFAVATVDSYILNGAPVSFPATIAAVIDESKGADAVLANKAKISSLEDLKRKQFKMALTPNSPSDHIRKVLASHFDITSLKNKGPWLIEANGSPEALKKLLKGEVDVAILWESDVSKALAKLGIIKLIGTENMEKVIVDILLANRDFAEKNPQTVQLVLANYFRALKYYKDDPSALKKEIAHSTSLSDEQIEIMLKGVEWSNLSDNAGKWFGINAPGGTAQDGIIDVIESSIRILIDNGDFKSNPLAGGDPYSIVNSSFIAKLFNDGVEEFSGSKNKAVVPVDSLEKKFKPLDASGWNLLKEVGVLKVRPITFQSGMSDLALEGKEGIDLIVKDLKSWPNFRVVIKGHTNLKGDPEANRKLSADRADAVARYIEITYGVDTNRIRVLGIGSDKPLPKQPGESDRSYNYRLPRVEICLVSEVY